MLKKLISKVKSIVSVIRKKHSASDTKYADVNITWDTYDEREIQKTTNELKNTLVDIPYFFSYEEEEDK